MKKKVSAFLFIAALCVPVAFAAEPREAKHEATQGAAQLAEVVGGWVRALLKVLAPLAPPGSQGISTDCRGTIDPNGGCQP
jgi:hypothetical protein